MTTMEILKLNSHVNQLLNNIIMENDVMARKSYGEGIMDDIMTLSEALLDKGNDLQTM